MIMSVASSEGDFASGVPSSSTETKTAVGNKVESQVKVLLVEDHALFRTQLIRMITRDSRFTVCGESDNASQALEAIRSLKPDLVIVDITLKGVNGLELIKQVRAEGLAMPIVVLSMHDEILFAERALRAGANGYVTKNQTSAELVAAIHCVLGGALYLNTRMTTEMLRRAATAKPGTEARGVNMLSPREMDIFRRIARGCSTRDIAAELHLGEKTVHSHRLQIKSKLGVKHSAELYSIAARWAEEERNSTPQVGIAPHQKLPQDESKHD